VGAALVQMQALTLAMPLVAVYSGVALAVLFLP
jgi:hypothetical protein